MDRQAGGGEKLWVQMEPAGLGEEHFVPGEILKASPFILILRVSSTALWLSWAVSYSGSSMGLPPHLEPLSLQERGCSLCLQV